MLALLVAIAAPVVEGVEGASLAPGPQPSEQRQAFDRLVHLYAGLSDASKARAWAVLAAVGRDHAPTYAEIASHLRCGERFVAHASGVPTLYGKLDEDGRRALLGIIDNHRLRHIDPLTALAR